MVICVVRSSVILCLIGLVIIGVSGQNTDSVETGAETFSESRATAPQVKQRQIDLPLPALWH